MEKFIVAAALLGAGFSAPALAQDTAPADLGGFRLEGVATYEGNKGKNIGFGVGAGYDAQVGGVVLGVEAEAVLPGDKQCLTESGFTACARTSRDLYVGARVGVAIAANTLIYAKAGYTNARLKSDFASPTEQALEYQTDLDGVRVGGGVQLGLGRSLYIKGEYRYSDYQYDNHKHTGVVGLGFKF